MSMRRRAGVWKWVLIVIGGLLMLALSLVALMTSVTGSRWQRYAASVRATGQPLTYAEIESQRDMIRDDQNGALVIERLMTELDLLVRPTGERRYVFRFGRKAEELDLFEGVPRHVVDASRKFVLEQKDLLGQLAVMDSRPRGYFLLGYDPVDPMGTLLPHIWTIRHAMKLEYAAAAVALWDGDHGAALKHIRRIFHAAGSLHQEPVLISYLAQISTYRTGVEAIEGFLRTREISDEMLLELDRLLEEHLSMLDIRWALLGERALFVETCDSVAKGKLSPRGLVSRASGSNFMPIYSVNFVLRSNQIVGAKLYTSMIDVAHDFPQLLAAAQAANTSVRGLSAYHGLTRMFFPDLAGAVKIAVESESLIESARCAIAVERFRGKTGDLPSSLEVMVPEFLQGVPQDLFGNGPLKFKSTNDGVTIYSLASDGIDDGGMVAPRGRGREPRNRDIGFRLLPPEKRGVVILDVPPPGDEE